MPEKIITLTPNEQSMATLQNTLEEFFDLCGIPMKYSMKLLVVTDEVYSNILLYSQATKAEVTCRADENHIELTFADNGIPYNPLTNESPDTTLPAEEREIGGLGILITRKLMDQTTYEYRDGRNYLNLSKSFA